MGKLTIYPTQTRYYQDGTTKVYTDMYAGRTSTSLYYTLAIFNIPSADLAGKTIKYIRYIVKTTAQGNATPLPAGCGASKTWSYSTCQAICQNPTAAATILQGTGIEWVFDLTPDATVIADTSTPTYIYMGPRDTTASTYKVFGSVTNAAISNRPYLEIATMDGAVMRYNGTSWETCEVRRYNGTSWEQVVPYYYDGDAWRECGQ